MTTALDRGGTGQIAEICRQTIATRAPRTQGHYRDALSRYGAFRGGLDPIFALEELLRAGPGDATMSMLSWQAEMRARGLAPATINQRVSAIRAVVAAFQPLTGWELKVKGIKSRRVRDVRGPTVEEFRSILAVLEGDRDEYPWRTTRLVLALRLASDLSFRVREICELTWPADCGDTIRTRRKAQEGLTDWAPSAAVREAIAAWVHERGDDPGPLLRSHAGHALSPRDLQREFADIGRRAGVKRCSPNAIRHLSNTLAVELAPGLGLTLDECRSHTGHAGIATLLLYRDARAGVQGRLADAVSAALTKPKGDTA